MTHPHTVLHIWAFMSNEILELSGFPLTDIIPIKYFATLIFEIRNIFLILYYERASIGIDWSGITYKNPSLYTLNVSIWDHIISWYPSSSPPVQIFVFKMKISKCFLYLSRAEHIGLVNKSCKWRKIQLELDQELFVSCLVPLLIVEEHDEIDKSYICYTFLFMKIREYTVHKPTHHLISW